MDRYFKKYVESDYARPGDVASESVVLDAGPMKQFNFALEPRLRDLGLPTKLEKGVIVLEKDHVVCEEGDVLTHDQTMMLVSGRGPRFADALLPSWTR